MKRQKGDPDEGTKGGIMPILHPVHVSNVSLIDPETKFPINSKLANQQE